MPYALQMHIHVLKNYTLNLSVRSAGLLLLVEGDEK